MKPVFNVEVLLRTRPPLFRNLISKLFERFACYINILIKKLYINPLLFANLKHNIIYINRYLPPIKSKTTLLHQTFSKNGCSKHFFAENLCLKSKVSIFFIKSNASHVALDSFPLLMNSSSVDAFYYLISPFSKAIKRSKQIFSFL